MASELSRFIEDELRKQGIHDDEEQRLLVANRVKPLAVEGGGLAASGASASRWQLKHKLLAAAGVAALFLGLVLVVLAVRQPHSALAKFTGAVADPDAGPGMIPKSETGGKNRTAGASAAPASQQRGQQAAAQPPPKERPPEPKQPAPQQQQQQNEEYDYEDEEIEKEAAATKAKMPPPQEVPAPPTAPAAPAAPANATTPTPPAKATPAAPTLAKNETAAPAAQQQQGGRRLLRSRLPLHIG